jgi:hypothetical protein
MSVASSTSARISSRPSSGNPGVLSEEGSFDATEAGKLGFANYLAGNRKSIFSILANVSDEGFHIETIPFLRGADRTAIVRRKLGQLFFSAALTTSMSLSDIRSHAARTSASCSPR